MSENITFEQLGMTPEEFNKVLAEMDQYILKLNARLDELGIARSLNQHSDESQEQANDGTI